jgi:hypothetical protein
MITCAHLYSKPFHKPGHTGHGSDDFEYKVEMIMDWRDGGGVDVTAGGWVSDRPTGGCAGPVWG